MAVCGHKGRERYAEQVGLHRVWFVPLPLLLLHILNTCTPRSHLPVPESPFRKDSSGEPCRAMPGAGGWGRSIYSLRKAMEGITEKRN